VAAVVQGIGRCWNDASAFQEAPMHSLLALFKRHCSTARTTILNLLGLIVGQNQYWNKDKHGLTRRYLIP
jgi:hypothetical protein